MPEVSVTIEKLTHKNFTPASLDGFDRFQEVTEVWRRVEGAYRLVRAPFTEEWSPARRREKAAEVLSGDYIAYGAVAEGRIVGLLLLEKQLRGRRMVVSSLHVDRGFRHGGLGRMLFRRAMEEGRRAGAAELYISACSARETIAFYRAMGCVPANPVIPELAEAEPCDLQLVCPL